MSIIGLTRTDALSVLQTSMFDFYLGGSRRMAQLQQALPASTDLMDCPQIDITTTTDYDFYTTYSVEVAQFLIDSEFADTAASVGAMCSSPTSHHYLDTEAVRILSRDDVQVVLRRDADFYRQVFESISINFYYTNLWKSSPQIINVNNIQPIFNALYATALAFDNRT